MNCGLSPSWLAVTIAGKPTGDFVPALEQFMGSTAGLSPATVNRLTVQWTEEQTVFLVRVRGRCRRDRRVPL